jgi:hypothetical protein
MEYMDEGEHVLDRLDQSSSLMFKPFSFPVSPIWERMVEAQNTQAVYFQQHGLLDNDLRQQMLPN